MNFLGYGAEYINYCIQYYNYCINILNLTYKQTTANTLVFFDKNPTPYFSSYLDLHNQNNGVIVWNYDMNKKLFYQYNCSIKDTKKYPIMTAYIEINNESKIYLDDFLENIYIEASNQNYPTLQQLIEVWTYTSGIVLDRTIKHNFIYIDNEVNEITLDLFNESFNF